MPVAAHRELDAWQGDFDELAGHEQRLQADKELCDRVFASKHEAYLAGRYLADLPRRSDRIARSAGGPG